MTFATRLKEQGGEIRVGQKYGRRMFESSGSHEINRLSFSGL